MKRKEKPSRKDYYLWRFRLIVRRFRDRPPHYGFLTWRVETISTQTFDIWVHRTLYTFCWQGRVVKC
jgi:hypothetical protein